MNEYSKRKFIRYLFIGALAFTGVSASTLSITTTKYQLALKKVEKLRDRNYNLADKYMVTNMSTSHVKLNKKEIELC